MDKPYFSMPPRADLVQKYKDLPYEGPPIDLRKDDKEPMLPRMVKREFIAALDSKVDEDMRLYNEVLARSCDGYVDIVKEEIGHRPQGGFDILLCWVDIRYTEPEVK